MEIEIDFCPNISHDMNYMEVESNKNNYYFPLSEADLSDINI
jgi:hypothetical protein